MKMPQNVNWRELLGEAKRYGIHRARIAKGIGHSRYVLEKWTVEGVDPPYSRASAVWNYLVERMPIENMYSCCYDSGD